MPTLIKTKILVKAALSNRKDQSGVPLYEHCVRVSVNMAQLLKKYKITDELNDYIHVALLHDVLEDSDLTEDDLHMFGYNNKTIDAVKLLTHDKKDVSYSDYIENLCQSQNLMALLGKLSDNMDNTCINRHSLLNEKSREYFKIRYAGVREKLEEAIAKCLAQ